MKCPATEVNVFIVEVLLANIYIHQPKEMDRLSCNIKLLSKVSRRTKLPIKQVRNTEALVQLLQSDYGTAQLESYFALSKRQYPIPIRGNIGVKSYV